MLNLIISYKLFLQNFIFSANLMNNDMPHTASPSYSILQMSLWLFLLLPWSSISEWRYCVARHVSHCHAVCVSATVKAISCIQCSLVLININIIHPSRILKLGFRPPNLPCLVGRIGPLSNIMLLGTARVSLPNGISFCSTALSCKSN